MAEIKAFERRIAGIDTFYRHGGSGKPVVFLHGVPTSSYLWRKVLVVLAADFSVYAPDLPGYARSSLPTDFSIAAYTDWLAAFCEFAGGGEPVSLVTHDVGGTIGLAFAITHAEWLDRLVVMDTFIPWKIPFWVGMVTNPLMAWLQAYLTPRPVFRLIMKRRGVHRPELFDRSAVDHYYGVTTQDRRRRVSSKIYRAWKDDLAAVIGGGISHIRTDTLVLWGANDQVLPVAWSKEIVGPIHNSVLKVLPNCGHYAPEEDPVLVAESIRGFLK